MPLPAKHFAIMASVMGLSFHCKASGLNDYRELCWLQIALAGHGLSLPGPEADPGLSIKWALGQEGVIRTRGTPLLDGAIRAGANFNCRGAATLTLVGRVPCSLGPLISGTRFTRPLSSRVLSLGNWAGVILHATLFFSPLSCPCLSNNPLNSNIYEWICGCITPKIRQRMYTRVGKPITAKSSKGCKKTAAPQGPNVHKPTLNTIKAHRKRGIVVFWSRRRYVFIHCPTLLPSLPVLKVFLPLQYIFINVRILHSDIDR